LRIWKRSLSALDHGVRAAENRLLELLQTHLVEPAQVHDGAVVALHELLDRQHVGGILVAKQLRDACLMIEQQAIFLAPGEQMQGKADAPEKLAALEQEAKLRCAQKAASDQVLETFAAEVHGVRPRRSCVCPAVRPDCL
jgi:hypothetical protein